MNTPTSHPLRWALALSSVFFFAFLGCNSSSPTEPSDPNSAAQLRLVPAAATIDGILVSGQANAYRNFMPPVGASPDTRLSVFTNVHPAQQSGGVPTGLAPSRVWVVFGDQVWAVANPTFEILSDSTLLVTVLGGPRWPLHESVDVVVELRSGNGQTVRIKSPSAEIRGLS